jgi:prepilin-type N-terminal cleavage/methylation domain-containing protein
MRFTRSSRSRGVTLIEMTVGLALLGVMILLLTSLVAQQRRGSDRLDRQRGAVRLAERGMSRLERGLSLETPPSEPDSSWRVSPLSESAPQGLRWVRLEAIHRDAQASLIGLVPDLGDHASTQPASTQPASHHPGGSTP